MEYTAKQISELLGGTVEGNYEEKVSRLSKIEDGVPGSLSFLANPKYEEYIYSTNASVIIVNKDFSPSKKIKSTLVRVENAYTAFVQLLEIYNSIQRDKK